MKLKKRFGGHMTGNEPANDDTELGLLADHDV